MTRKPKLFLLDEPLSNLDAALRVGMRVEIARLKAELASTMVYVTHDQVEAMTLADRIVVMNGGRIEQVGTPLELYHRPANLFVAGFIGSPAMNFLKGCVDKVQGNQVTVSLDLGLSLTMPVSKAPRAGVEVTVGIRPEHIVLSAEGQADAFVVQGKRGRTVGQRHVHSCARRRREPGHPRQRRPHGTRRRSYRDLVANPRLPSLQQGRSTNFRFGGSHRARLTRT